MSRRRLIRAAVSILLILATLTSSAAAADAVRVKKTTGTLPKPSAIAFASGSGLVISKRFILTNRHIAQDEKGKLFDGFRVYLGPDYKKAQPARVVSVCENYDLALLETSTDMPAKALTVLDGLPPLSERVIAYGFPLGSRFGVGLTTTGGQVSRHPVATAKGDDEEDVSVKTALWHDAVLASGNSGGPLFTSSKLLVGVNFAYLSSNSKQALAVPGNVVADFLRRAGAAKEVTIAQAASADAGGADPQAMTVFIEAMVNDVTGRAPDLEGASSLGDLVMANLKTRLPAVSAADFKRVETGELHRAFPPVKVAAIEAGDVVRLRGEMTIRSVREDGMLTMVDGVLCLVVLPPGDADEVRTRLAKNPNPKAPIDQLYFVGPPATLRVSDGSTLYALVLLPLKKFAESSDFKKLLEEEKARREIKISTEGDPQQEKTISRYVALLRHTFTDASGKFKIDAVPVKVGMQNVDLVRLPEKQKLSVAIDKLSADDRNWIRDNEKWVSLYGKRLEDYYIPAAVPDKGK
ncbi:MAG: serine protease [Pirellulales bacterium]